MDTRALGLAVVELGGGRRAPADVIDPAVGLSDIVAIGDSVDGERPLAVVQARSEATAEQAAETLRQAIKVGNTAVTPPTLIPDVIRREAP
jgi:thymidine phosphorylase